jgi:hypothetical protein
MQALKEIPMANREQRSSKEKKKPKQNKDDKLKPASGAAPSYVQPELIRKPHKGKDWT